MSSNIQKTAFSHYIHYIITAIIIFGVRLLPPADPITEEGMVLLGAFIGAVYGWSFIDMLWPSMLAFFSMGLQLGMDKVVAAGLGSTITWMLMMFYIVIGIMNEAKLVDSLAAFFMTRKIIKGRPWIMFAIIIIANFLCSLLSGFGSLVLFLALVFKMCGMLRIAPYSKLPTMLGIGVAFGTALAAIMFPFKGTSLNCLVVWQGITGESIEYLTYMSVSFPMAFFLLILLTLIARFIIRVDVSEMKNFNPTELGIVHEKLNRSQKIAILIVVWAMVNMFLPGLLPSTWGFTKLLNSLTLFGQVSIPLLLFMVIRVDGKPVINFRHIASKYIPWDLFMLMGIIMPLASFLTAETTGIQPFMVGLTQPLQSLGVVGFLLLLMAVTVVLTNFANNFVVAMIMMPVIYAFSLSNEALSSTAALMVLIICSHFAFLTPGATPFAAIMIGNSDWISPKNILRWGIPTVIALFICTLPVVYFWASFIC